MMKKARNENNSEQAWKNIKRKTVKRILLQ